MLRINLWPKGISISIATEKSMYSTFQFGRPRFLPSAGTLTLSSPATGLAAALSCTWTWGCILTTDRWSDLEHHGKVELERRTPHSQISTAQLKLMLYWINRIHLFYYHIQFSCHACTRTRRSISQNVNPQLFAATQFRFCCILLCHSLTPNRLLGFWTFCRLPLFCANETQWGECWLRFCLRHLFAIITTTLYIAGLALYIECTHALTNYKRLERASDYQTMTADEKAEQKRLFLCWLCEERKRGWNSLYWGTWLFSTAFGVTRHKTSLIQ